MMAYLQVGKEKSTIHVFDQFNQHRWNPEPNRHDVAQLREVHCNRAKCSTLTTLCINNFNCSVDFRAFSRYTAIKKIYYCIPFPCNWRICKNRSIKMPHTVQILFPISYSASVFWELTYYLTTPRLMIDASLYFCHQRVTNQTEISACLCSRESPVYTETCILIVSCVGLSDRLPFRQWTS